MWVTWLARNDYNFNTITWSVDRLQLEIGNGLLDCVRVAFHMTLAGIKQRPQETEYSNEF